jgi:hypothetical protein
MNEGVCSVPDRRVRLETWAMKALRIAIVVALLAYVAWIAVPGVQTFFTQYLAPAEAGLPPPAEEAVDDLAPVIEAAPQSETTATAVAQGDAPKIGLWGAAIVLYLVAAILFANGNTRAFLAYMLGFAADAVLMALNRPDMNTLRSAVENAVPDLKWIVIGGLGAVGFAILAMAGRSNSGKAKYA